MLNICRPCCSICVAVDVSLQMILMRCVYGFILMTSVSFIHGFLCYISFFSCYGECSPTCESSCLMKIVLLLLCSGGMTGCMFIALKSWMIFAK